MVLSSFCNDILIPAEAFGVVSFCQFGLFRKQIQGKFYRWNHSVAASILEPLVSIVLSISNIKASSLLMGTRLVSSYKWLVVNLLLSWKHLMANSWTHFSLPFSCCESGNRVNLIYPLPMVALRKLRSMAYVRVLSGMRMLFPGWDWAFPCIWRWCPSVPALSRALLPEGIWLIVINSLVKA